MKVLSLFSGVGGFDRGLENAGMETVFQCEWDKHANSILYKHWPDVPKWDDVSTLTGKHILAHAPVVDVVAWGSPCQDLSVAGKRAGLEGARSGLFNEGIRIIKELQEESNGQYPRISIWENVVGALNSNRGADFGVILDQMAEAGAVVIEWAVLDAQHFGVPQRRRRVFVIAIFDSATASRCRSPLLPVCESLPGYLAKGKPKRQSAATTLAEGVGTDGQWWDGRDTAEALTTTSSRAQTSEDSETWIPGEVNPTLNSFDVGDTRATIAIVEPVLIDGQRVGDVHIYTEPVQTLGARMGAGGNNMPMLAFDTQFGSNANVTEDVAPTLKASQQSPSVAYDIQGNMIGRQDHNGPAGRRHTEEGDPMFTLTSTDIHAVAYDEYNDTTNEVHHALRAGTKQSTGVLLGSEVAATLRSVGDGGVPSSRGEHLVAEPTMAVRRLTPLECERLMGWPDDHTRWKSDGIEQADTHRYKQCGNGVASPVAQWIAKHILNI
jgi:DNA (cytosine-5)-methyltransferase 1